MRHRVAGRKLGRRTEHRLALLRNLSTALFEKERIRTTLAKAKELRPFAEKLITLAKKDTLHARRRVLRHIRNKKVVAKLFDTISARFAQRPGGYTRILKLGPRRGDHAEMALIELLPPEPMAQPAETPQGKGKKKKTAKKKASKSGPRAAAAPATAGSAKPARRRRKAKAEAEGEGQTSGRRRTAKRKTTTKKGQDES